MHGLKLYYTFEDINNYIRTKVDSKYKNSTFIPIKTEINENDMSIDVTLVTTDIEDCDYGRYKIELSPHDSNKKTLERGLRAKMNLIEDVMKPCYDCVHEGCCYLECEDCNFKTGFKYFLRRLKND